MTTATRTPEAHEIRDHAGRIIGVLTTDHAASSHGIPVLVIDGTAYGPDDVVDTVEVDAPGARWEPGMSIMDVPTVEAPRTAREWVRHYTQLAVAEALPHDAETRMMAAAARLFTH